jgi:hypothetical protein
MKKILGLAAVMVLAMSQLSFSAKSDTDAAVQRLVKVAKQRQALLQSQLPYSYDLQLS